MFSKLRNLMPGRDPETIRKLAVQALSKDDFGRAVNLYTQLLDHPTAAQEPATVRFGWYLNRGFARREIKRLKEALDDYDQAIALNPSSFKPYMNKALILTQDLGQNREALNEVEKALRIAPDDWQSLVTRANIKADLDDIAGAEADYNRALMVDPSDAQTLYNLGNLFLQKNEPNEAVHFYRRALRLDPHDEDTNYNLAIAEAHIAGILCTRALSAEEIRNLRSGISFTIPIKCPHCHSESQVPSGQLRDTTPMSARQRKEFTRRTPPHPCAGCGRSVKITWHGKQLTAGIE